MSITDNSLLSTQGERIAIGGYLPQYEEFARAVYDNLNAGILEEIRVADSEEHVGKLDDICYVTTTEVHGYQVKWSNTDKEINYVDFKALIVEAVDGWQKLRVLYPNKIIKTHILTNKPCSKHDRAIPGKIKGGFQTYVDELLPALYNGTPADAKWDAAIQELDTITNLKDADKDTFWRNFTLIYSYVPEDVSVKWADASKRVEDVRKLVSFIVEKAAGKKAEVVISSDEIKSGLNWNSRFESIYNHNLVVSESTYEPNSKGISLLDEALKNKTKGYIFLKGNPGSGKSTLLTQWSRNIPNKTFRYYVFDFTDPSSQRYNDAPRGEGVTFLFDLVVMIEMAGYGTSGTLRYKDHAFLKQRFYELLDELSKEYQKTNLPAVIIVDGLDHIVREYGKKSSNLMDSLPSLADLPEGVVFVLGSQYYENLGLNATVEAELNHAGSVVDMPPFNREEVAELIAKLLGTAVATEELIDKCNSKSQGHPLYLRYLLTQILEKGEIIIDTIEPYNGDIESYYTKITGSLLDNIALNHLLGLMSRVAGDIELSSIRKWSPDPQTQLGLRRNMWHLFKVNKDGTSLSIFHNSFRQYLMVKTAEDILTRAYSEELNASYYQELSIEFVNSWDAGYYLYQAGSFDTFVEKLTPEALYSQIQNFRPVWSVRRDLRYALEIAKKRKDAYLLLRYMLFEAQLSQMENQDYSSLLLVEEFLQMGKTALAKSLVREHNRLYCSKTAALEYAKVFMKYGEREEAISLFDLAYPDFVSKQSTTETLRHHDYNERLEYLQDWISTAAYFLSWPEIEERIPAFSTYLKHIGADDYAALSQADYPDLFKYRYVKSMAKQGRLDEAIAAVGRLEEDKHPLLMAWQCWKNTGDKLLVAKYLEQASWGNLGSYYLHEARETFNKLKPHITYFRLRSLLGYDDVITELVPDNDSHKDNPLMEQYVRRVFYLAKLQGRALAGIGAEGELLQITENYLRFFDSVPPMGENRYAYTISCQRADFYEYMVQTSALYGGECLNTMALLMERCFADGHCKASADDRRRAVMALYDKGYDMAWCKRMLATIESTMMEHQDLDGRANEAYRQGKAWLEVGEKEKAEELFKAMLQESFGVGYRKDYQPTTFVEWIDAINQADKEHSEERIHWITSRLRYLKTVSETNISNNAALSLLNITLQYNAASGIKLAQWLLDEEFSFFTGVSRNLILYWLSKVNTAAEYKSLLAYYLDIYIYFDDRSYEADASLLVRVVDIGRRILADDFHALVPMIRRRIDINCPENQCTEMVAALEKALSDGDADADDGQHGDRDEFKKKLAAIKQLAEAGDKEKAWNDAITLLAEGRSSGWVRYYDGGTRIDTCQLLETIDPIKGRAFTFDLFADEVTDGNNYGAMQYLDEILPLLTEQADASKVFAEQLSYMNRIMRENTSNPLDMPDITPDEWSVSEGLEHWLLYLASQPVMCLAERAKMQLARMVDAGRESIIGMIAATGDVERLTLEIGMYLREMKSGRLSVVKDIAFTSALSHNYLYRVYAKKILKTLGENLPQTKRSSLSPVYGMVFAEKTKFDFGNSAPKQYGVRDWEDADSIMSVASHISGYLAYATGFNQRSINVRAVELMRKYCPVTDVNTERDKQIAKHYDDIGLRYPYRRAHAQAALDAMYEAAAELMDAGAVGGQYDDDWFMSYDFSLINVDAKQRPDFIQRIADPDAWMVDKDWLTNLSSSPRFADGIVRYEDLIVIGEYTHLQKREDKVPVEEFSSKISFEGVKADEKDFFGDSPFQKQSSSYLSLGKDDPQVIVMRGGYYSISSIKPRWIALNPSFAFCLGWVPSDDGLFAWCDKNGRKIVESVYWQCGNVHGRDRSNYEASEGWLVVASQDAFDAICACGKLYHHKMLRRGMWADKYDFEKSEYKIYKCD